MSLNRLWQLTARKLTEDITLEELQELEQLLKAYPEVVPQLKLHNQYFKSGNYNGETPESAEAWQRQRKALHKNFPQSFPLNGQKLKKAGQWKVAMKAAVVFILSATIVATVYILKQPQKNMETAEAVAAKQPSNNPHWVKLPDGSKVKLNKKSHISLSKEFGQGDRNVSLEGEAFFDVVHDSKKPFIVEVGSIRVKVLGTSFNVRAYLDEGNVQTSLFRGSVEVTDRVDKNLRVLLKPNEKLTMPIMANILKHTAKSSFVEEFPYKIETLQEDELSGIIPEMAWIQHKLVFNGNPLSEVALKLGKWHNVNIIIEDPSLQKERFTAVFENENIEEALYALTKSYPFHFRKKEDGSIVIYK